MSPRILRVSLVWLVFANLMPNISATSVQIPEGSSLFNLEWYAFKNIEDGLLSDSDDDNDARKSEILKSIVDVLLAQNCLDPPDSCPNDNITFWLFTRSTQNDPVVIDVSNSKALRQLKYGKNDPWKLIVHGYTGFRDYSPNSELRPAYFQKGDYNIISIDYSPLVREPCYLQSVFNVPLIANCTAHMIDTMVGEGIFKLEQLHVIGFSLGGQISGHLSNYLKSGMLKRITGLDPALPLFIGNALGKLDKSDAEFVDVIHTDAGRKGKLERSGHVDFYPNGGYSQIGCIDTENFTYLGDVAVMPLRSRNCSTFRALSGCNHVRASYYFAESIASDKGFWGIPCNSYIAFYWGWCAAEEQDLVIMGEYTPPTARGTYYLETNKVSPYALGKKLVAAKPEHGKEPEEVKNPK